MKKYELDAEQQVLLERSFQLSPPIDGTLQKFETMNEKVAQTARFLMSLSPKSPEQTMGLRKLQEARFWFEEAIRKNEV